MAFWCYVIFLTDTYCNNAVEVGYINTGIAQNKKEPCSKTKLFYENTI